MNDEEASRERRRKEFWMDECRQRTLERDAARVALGELVRVAEWRVLDWEMGAQKAAAIQRAKDLLGGVEPES